MKLAGQVSKNSHTHHRRELDMLVSVGERISMALLSMAITDCGIGAVSLTGSQSGIITTDSHGEAEIVEIRGDRVKENLQKNKVVIIAGFQGVSSNKEITTFGRGGSDTTALALAISLGAPCAHIYSDVDAYFSADPKLVPSAIRHEVMPWEMGLLSSFYGARVLHHRAAELAAKHQLEVRLLSTFNPQGNAGVLRGSVMENIEQYQVFTLNVKKGLRKLTTVISGTVDKDYLTDLKELLTPPHLGFLVQSSHNPSKMFFHFGEVAAKTQEGLKNFSHDDQEYWKISLVGTGLQRQSSLLKRMQTHLTTRGVEIVAYEWNPLTLSVTTKAFPDVESELINKLHDEFLQL